VAAAELRLHETTKQVPVCLNAQRTNLSMPPRERTDLNMTRRLTRFIRLSGLPLTGPAHQLRMDFVRATHALCILQRSCTRGKILKACCELLEGWAEREEHHSREGGYQHRLLNAVDDLHSQIETSVWQELPAWPNLPPWH
jgi:hypothetical protein